MNKQKNIKQYYEEEKWYHLFPVIFLIVVVPLIVYLKVIPLSGAMYDFWNGETQNLDFFSYYKSVWIMICAVLALVMLGIKTYKNGFKDIKKSYLYIPIGIYSLFVILSTIFSKYPEVAKWGFVDRYEGMYVIISYMVLVFVVMNLVKNETHLKVLVGALFTGALILGIIGLFQYLGYDIWKSGFGKSLMLPSEYQQFADKLEFQFGKGQIYATLYHRDYVGSYMAMLFPMAFSLLIFIKNKKMKIFMLFFTLLMGFNWLGCNSRAGLVGGLISLIILLVMMNRYIKTYWKYFTGGFLLVILLSIGLNIVSKGIISSRINSLIEDVKIIVLNKSTDKNAAEESIPLKDVKVNGNSAEVITTTETLKFEMNQGSIAFSDENNSPIDVSFDESTGELTLYNDKYQEYQLVIENKGDKVLLHLTKGAISFNFDITNNVVSVVDNKGRNVDLNPVEKWGFEGKERIGSSRGYIWSRSIPLIKNTKLIGYGPDTFAIYFPQNDFKGKLYAYWGEEGAMWQTVDKAHNMYLQTAINTGCVSLLAMLAIFIMYFVSCIKLYIKSEFNNFSSIVGVSIFVAVFGYLGSAFFNDSIVSVAPVFWVLLSMGIATNYIVKSEKIDNINKGKKN